MAHAARGARVAAHFRRAVEHAARRPSLQRAAESSGDEE
jgi:hypothetical protein